MTDQCCGGACRRSTPIRVLASGLTDRYYALTRYRVHGDGTIEAQEKHDVTSDVKALVDQARWCAEQDAALSTGPRLIEAMRRDHVRASTDAGPDYCATCSDAVAEWVEWPCPVAAAVDKALAADRSIEHQP